VFVRKARSLPLSGSPERCFTLVGSRLAHKLWNILEMLTREKH
jgi:hypothetical protein